MGSVKPANPRNRQLDKNFLWCKFWLAAKFCQNPNPNLISNNVCVMFQPHPTWWFNGSISNLQSQMGVCVMNFSLHGSSSHRLLFGAWYYEGTLKHWDKLGWFWYELGTTLDEGVWVWDENGKYWKGLLGWVWGEVGWSGMSFGKDQEDFFLKMWLTKSANKTSAEEPSK